MDERNLPPLDDLVMEKILGLIECGATLRSCRAVDFEWHNRFNKKAFANSVFTDLSKVIIPFPNGLGYHSESHSFDERVFVDEIINLRISTSKELLQDKSIIDFFEEKGQHLKYLALEDIENFSAKSGVHLEFMDSVLFKWCHKLETLKLMGMSEYRRDASASSFEKIEIPLKNFIMDYGKYEFFLPSQRLMSFANIFESAKKLESMTYIGSSGVLQIHHIPETFVRLLSINCKSLANLEFDNVRINRRSFNVIVNAGWPLRKFVFNGHFEEDMTTRDLNALLQSYNASLKHVHLHVLWTGWYTEREVETVIHQVQHLESLKLNVDKLNVGYSGQIGELQSLRHLELQVDNPQFGTQYDLHTMFRITNSSSLRYLFLDEWYADYIDQVRETCPNIKVLEVKCKARKFAELFSNLNISSHNSLEDLTIIAHYQRSDAADNIWANHLATGLYEHRLRVFKLVNSNFRYHYCRPFIYKNWISRWLSGTLNTYFRLEFVGFMIRADEVDVISRLLSKKANFTKLVDCIIVDMSDIDYPNRFLLKNVEFFQNNVEDLLLKIKRGLNLI